MTPPPCTCGIVATGQVVEGHLHPYCAWEAQKARAEAAELLADHLNASLTDALAARERERERAEEYRVAMVSATQSIAAIRTRLLALAMRPGLDVVVWCEIAMKDLGRILVEQEALTP